MNVHEYQAKQVLATYGIPVPEGRVISTAKEAATAFEEVAPAAKDGGDRRVVVKAQIHAGGRGKGGGVKVVDSASAAVEAAAGMLGKPLMTHQTGPEGRVVQRVWIEQASRIRRELYVGLVLDRTIGRPVIMASPDGGVEIEEVAAKTPERIHREPIDPAIGLQPYQVRNLAAFLGLSREESKQAGVFFGGLAKLFVEKDCSLAEINPLAVVEGKGLLALDAKLNFDDRALYRHPDILELRDLHEEDPREVEAGEHDLSYVSMDGNIGCMVNGAGLAMATMDMIQQYGGMPANFLDVGGGAGKERVSTAFRIILANRGVAAILVNIFGGIVKCDLVAQGIVDAAKEISLDRPLVVRLEGTNVEEGRRILSASGLKITSADGMADAAEKVVASIR